MKTLTLLRHAKSGDDAVPARDFDRALNAKGRRAARAMGRRMRELGMRFDRVVASPAVRVAQTIEEAAAGFGTGSVVPLWERRLYLATAADLLEVVRATPDAVERLLLVGHNPGLEELVLLLVPAAGTDARAAVEEKYPTASVAEIALPVAAWTEVAAGGGRLARFVRPRDIDPALGPDG